MSFFNNFNNLNTYFSFGALQNCFGFNYFNDFGNWFGGNVFGFGGGFSSLFDFPQMNFNIGTFNNSSSIFLNGNSGLNSTNFSSIWNNTNYNFNTNQNIFDNFNFSNVWSDTTISAPTKVSNKEKSDTKTDKNPESKRKNNSGLKGKHWTEMTDSELQQVYGHYDRSITAKYNGTAADLNKYLKGKGKLEGLGQAFINAQNKYGISAVVLVGICMNESGRGKHLAAANNVAGVRMKGSTKFRAFNSIEECINTVASMLKNSYITPPEKGKVASLDKLYLVNARYCPSSDPTDTKNHNALWASIVEKFASEAERAKA